MNHMLGGQESISSLRNEVATLQAAMVTLTSKAGTINTPSWKYPDKLSSELDFTELLELYDYAEEDEEKSQIAHAVLLELIIDRLLVILQLTSKILSCEDAASGDGSESGQSVSSMGNIINSFCLKVTHCHRMLEKAALVKDDVLSLTSEVRHAKELSRAASVASSEQQGSRSPCGLVMSVGTDAATPDPVEHLIEQPVFDQALQKANLADSAVNTQQSSSYRVDRDEARPRLRDRELIKNPLQEAEIADGKQSMLGCIKYDRRKRCPTCGLKPVRKVQAKKYECDLCHKGFSLRKHVDMHKKRMHVDSNKEKVSRARDHTKPWGGIGEGDFECHACKKRFKEDKLLQRHLRTRHRGTVYDTSRKRNKVERIIPEADGRFKCKECHKSFKTERILRKHIQIHTGEYTYKCSECGKGYYNIGSFKAHMSLHTGEKYFTCKECGKGFPHSSSYNFHIRTAHVTEQKFNCDICNRKYKSEKYLKDHMQSVHLQPNRYKCDTCGRTFGHRASLFMHVKTHKKDGECDSGPAPLPKKKAKSQSKILPMDAMHAKNPPVTQFPPINVQPMVRNFNMPLIKQIRNFPYTEGNTANPEAQATTVYIPQHPQQPLPSNQSREFVMPPNANQTNFNAFTSIPMQKDANGNPICMQAGPVPVLMTGIHQNPPMATHMPVAMPNPTIVPQQQDTKNLVSAQTIQIQTQNSSAAVTASDNVAAQNMQAPSGIYQIPWPRDGREFNLPIVSSAQNMTALPGALPNFAYNFAAAAAAQGVDGGQVTTYPAPPPAAPQTAATLHAPNQ